MTKHERDMVERVAKAIGSSLYGLVDPLDTPQSWEKALAVARNAIAAMREPTEAMTTTGFEAWRASSVRSDTSQGADIWRAMIDTALKDK